MEIFEYMRWRCHQKKVFFKLTRDWFQRKIAEGKFNFWGVVCDCVGNVLEDKFYPAVLQSWWFHKFVQRKIWALVSGKNWNTWPNNLGRLETICNVLKKTTTTFNTVRPNFWIACPVYWNTWKCLRQTIVLYVLQKLRTSHSIVVTRFANHVPISANQQHTRAVTPVAHRPHNSYGCSNKMKRDETTRSEKEAKRLTACILSILRFFKLCKRKEKDPKAIRNWFRYLRRRALFSPQDFLRRGYRVC